jgi:hypothetical protein
MNLFIMVQCTNDFDLLMFALSNYSLQKALEDLGEIKLASSTKVFELDTHLLS